MKKIVLNASDLIDIADVSNYARVGIQWQDEGKCMIIKTSEGFIGMNGSLDTVHCWSAKSIQEYVERALKQGNNEGSQAFYFSKVSELFKWMSE